MRRSLQALGVVMLVASALADEGPPAATRPIAQSDPQIGDCVIFREGGAGWLLKAPTYWLKGSIAGIARERRVARLCPRIGKPASAYTQLDRVHLAAATPCVGKASDVGEVDVVRVRVAVEAWETPWSHQHGTIGWLFRGQFLDQALQKGGVIDMDATWLERCESDA